MRVAVVGAGLAGLACARRLARAGCETVVLEAADTVGGRVRTEEVDGFLVDRGFQVLPTGFPAVRAQLDLDALRLRTFTPGVVVHRAGGFDVLSDPLQPPHRVLASLQSAALGPADALRLLVWRQRLVSTPGHELADAPQTTAAQRLDDLGFSTRAIERLFRPLLTGIFLDRGLTTSSRMVELVLRTLFLGPVALPARGMGRIPAQLAEGLDDVRLGCEVTAVDRRSVTLADGSELGAEAVVVATDPPAAERLLEGRLAAPPGLGSTTVWYAAPRAPAVGPRLFLEAEPTGPAAVVAVVSEVAPSYASAGAALVAASIPEVPVDDDAGVDAAVRDQLASWWGGTGRWEPLAVHRIPYARPRQRPGDLRTLRRPVRVDGRYVCGDHRDTGSIQGALVSGRRAAETLLASESGPAGGCGADS